MYRSYRHIVFLFCLSFAWLSMAHAQSSVYEVVSSGVLLPGSAIPAPSQAAVLTVRGRIGVTSGGAGVSFDLPTLEQIGLIRFTTPTTWTDTPVTFEGIPMARFLEVLAVSDNATQVQMTALDDYQVTIPLDDFRRWPVMLALKRNGDYMSVRQKGPLWVVYPRHAFPELNKPTHDPKWIWQLKEIVVR